MFNKELESNEKQEGLLKRLKNIEDKTDNLSIDPINSNKFLKIDFYIPQSERSRKAAKEINEIIDEIKKIKNLPRDKDTKKYLPKFNFIHSNKNEDDFDKYIDSRELGIDIRNGLMTIDEAKELKRQMKRDIDNLKNYSAKSDKANNIKSKFLENVRIPYEGIKKVTKGFEDGDFLIKNFSPDEQPSTSKDKEESEESDEFE